MAEYKLSYFNFKGRGELCRLLFVLADKKYEDHRFEREEWKDIKPCKYATVLSILKTSYLPRNLQIDEFVDKN
ncbi:Hypothetical predicted protein [Mytilus galloprovincialis]|uniref:GST N-terminal domain-containing protein n=1 Tax=Mytilus galloprovincialis TaxID=29158 RepID=A0A8B6BZL8_MYTGA|nr:Hypothetical predicted protein [Mytilus galloprovincialis]